VLLVEAHSRGWYPHFLRKARHPVPRQKYYAQVVRVGTAELEENDKGEYLYEIGVS
jgi:hypothetical protein